MNDQKKILLVSLPYNSTELLVNKFTNVLGEQFKFKISTISPENDLIKHLNKYYPDNSNDEMKTYNRYNIFIDNRNQMFENNINAYENFIVNEINNDITGDISIIYNIWDLDLANKISKEYGYKILYLLPLNKEKMKNELYKLFGDDVIDDIDDISNDYIEDKLNELKNYLNNNKENCIDINNELSFLSAMLNICS